MFAARYFAERFFPRRYFPAIGAEWAFGTTRSVVVPVRARTVVVPPRPVCHVPRRERTGVVKGD